MTKTTSEGGITGDALELIEHWIKNEVPIEPGTVAIMAGALRRVRNAVASLDTIPFPTQRIRDALENKP